MSGAEADISSDGETSFEDEDVPLPPSPFKEGTDEPFKVVLKGGSPWGFSIKGGSESKAAVLISDVETGGKAIGQLRPGDYLLQVNELRCQTLQVAHELIDSAFRTLTLLVWRGTTDSLSPPVRSASFLQKTRELSERARKAAVQDDSVLFSESKSASTRMKPRQRRIESFHGGRRGSAQSASTSASAAVSSTPVSGSSTPRLTQHGDGNQTSPPTSTAETTKPGLKGWATEHDLTSSRQPVIMSGSHMTRNVPLTPAKSSPSLNQDDLVNAVTTSHSYNPKSPSAHNMTKSTTDIPEHVNYENVTSPTSPKSPSWYQQKFPNRPVFDFSSSSSSRRSAGSPRNSYAGSSPRNSYASGSPRNSYAGGSPRNSYAGYSSTYMPSNYPQSPVSGFAPMSLSGSVLSQTDSNRTGANYAQTKKQQGAKQYSYDDTPKQHTNKNYDRRSLPPQALHQFRQEFQNTSKQDTPKHLTSMPVTREEEELDKEIPDMKPGPPNDLDLRPMYSPPAPPVRDISSLKYVTYRQNHEKYPSWPVTAAQPPQNLGPPIDTQQGEKSGESEIIEKSEKIQVQTVKPEGKRSPSVDRRVNDENKQNRNQSDPGFKQKPKKSFYTTRKPKEPSVEDTKPQGERFDEFCRQSKPGYPPPKLDPDGHNFGDEKYSIPSPPERDVPNLDEKSLVEKIAAVISPNSSYQPVYHHTFQYNMAAESNQPRTQKSDMATSPVGNSQISKYAGTYFQQAMNAQNLRPTNMSQNKNMVDSGTSPLQSPSEDRGRFLRTLSPHPRSETGPSPDKPRGVIVTQRPYYNTSTQTDDSLANQSEQSKGESGTQSETGLHSLSSVVSTVSTMRSDSSHSSGIGSMTFSDHSSAPMLRKLSEEFYRGKLTGLVPNEKRMSSASNYEELRTPRNDYMFGGMKEAESYNSVVIHAHESSGPFGRDDVGSSPNITSKHEVLDNEHEQYGDYRHKPRYSMDSATILQKHSGSMNMPPRGLNESRFTSESNLSSGNYSQRSHSQSLLHLNRPSSSLGEATQSRQFSQSNYSSSSSSSRPQGSMEARSSGSRVGSDSSVKGEKSRNGSDSVFYDRTSPVAQDINKDNAAGQSSTLGRKESMKMAYGTYDENEHHYATPYAHQRNSSEVLSPSARDSNIAHGRSMSYTDYVPMHYSQSESNRLDQIKEEGSESRWQEAVKKSKSLSRVNTSNYENIQLDLKEGSANRASDSDKSDSEKKRESKSGLRRFASEQLRPNKHDKSQQRKSDSNKSGYNTSSGDSSKGNKSDSENVSKSVPHQQYAETDLKRVQQKALLDFVERKSEKSRSSDSSEPQSPVVRDTSPEYPPPPPPAESTSPVNTASLPPQPSSPLISDLTKRYNYTKAQRNESLRRTQSITSTSSRDSSSDYMDMKRSERSYQTEWSRLRSQDGALPRRPLSIGSEISGVDHLRMSSPATTPETEVVHQRSSSETVPKHILAEQDRVEQRAVSPQQGGNDSMVTSPIYHNLSTGDYPRRPPPPVPGGSEGEAPPALPPRSYQRFASSKSESFLLSRVDQKQRDDLQESYNRDIVNTGTSRWDSSGTGTLKEDAYAQQLRRQARRFSEQHKPISMQVVSTKSTVQVSLSQSYKQEPTTPLEAVPVQKQSPTTSPSQTDVKSVVYHHSPSSSRERITPEPPPMPTPLKNGDTEIAVDLNRTADFPPPPVEFITSADIEQQSERCADDSYGSYKTRSAPREVGKYKRTTSDTTLLRSHQEAKPFRPHPELSSRDLVEITPNKPPRKKLELQGRNSPTQGYRSNSPGVHSTENQSTNQKPASQVPAFQSAEVTTVQHAQKSMAKPLPSVSVPKIASPSNISNSSGSFVGTVVQRPAMNQQDKTSTPDEHRCSVKDRVKNIEVFSHSPQSGKSSRQSHDSGNRDSLSPEEKEASAADSLEQLENSINSSDNIRDRLRPIVKKVEAVLPDQHVSHERVSADAADSAKVLPPAVPNRTYRQKAGVQNEPVYRKNSFQNNTGPRPYENKNIGSANIHSPLNQNNFVNYKQSSGSELRRSQGQSVPEPQVPSRHQKPNRGSNSEQNIRDQNSNIPSPDSRLKPNVSEDNLQTERDSVQMSSVQSGQKRNYESSFSRSRNHSASGSNTPVSHNSHQSDKNVANYKTRSPSNTQSEQNMRGNSHRTDSHRTDHRGDNSYERKPQSKETRSVGHSKDVSADSRQYRPQVNHVDNQNYSQSDYNSPTVSSKPENIDAHDKKRDSISNSEKDRHSSHLVTVNHGRQPSAEELECDKKAQELAKVLKDSDKQLCEVLTSDSKKIRMQYLDGILPVESDQDEQKRPRSGTKTEGSAEGKKENAEEPTSPMPSNYYVSPPKAMIELEIRKFGDQLTQDIGDNDALAQKKEELLQRMIKKVDILRDDKKELLIDIDENESLGKQVEVCVEKKCRNQQEKDKYRSYIEDIDKIIRLLLKLSGLLARAENTIQGLTENTNEKIKKMTFDKRDRLYQQHEDAKELKVDIDRRSDQVEAILLESLTTTELDDYHYYIKMKSKYTIQLQELEDKITLGNEQITALQKSIPNKAKS